MERTQIVRDRRVSSWEEVGSRVAAARAAAGFTQQQLAERVGLHRSALTRVEQGQRHLDALELVQLAGALGRSADWFVSSPPGAIASHRRIRSDDKDMRRLEDILEAVTRDVELLDEINELRATTLPNLALPKIETIEDAQSAATTVREVLPAGKDGPIHGLSEQVEHVGLCGFSFNLGPQVIDGGYVRVNNVGVAVVNGSTPAGRRRFSLAHELGHHVMGDEYSADFAIGQSREDRERLINAFAIHLLMPGASVHSRWAQLRRDGHESRAALIVIAAESRVSWAAACGHVCNLELVDVNEHDRLAIQRPTAVDYIELGVRFDQELEPVSLPAGYARAVLGAYRRYKIGRVRAIELLRGTVAPEELPEPNELPIDALRSDFAEIG